MFAVQPLFDQSCSYKQGGIVPIRLQLLDAQGANISSELLLPTAADLVLYTRVAAGAVVDGGTSNPDSGFRYDSTRQAYGFNLSTKGLSYGTWQLRFTVPGESWTYQISFSVR